nr:5'-methylthioadenosine/S-adenosylhomocysteine nucleosidase [uncultured Anaeromusa sp.]
MHLEKIIVSFVALWLTMAVPAGAQEACVLIQGAMEIEIRTLVERLEEPQTVMIDGWTYWQGRVDDQKVVVSQTKVGTTNAAAATLLGIQHFSPTVIINQGTAGGYPAWLHQGDLIIGATITNAGAVNVARREAGQGLEVREWSVRDEFGPVRWRSDAHLVRLAEALKEVYSQGRVHTGTIFSSDRWSRELDYIAYWQKKENVLGEEMEAAASAQLAAAYQIPYLCIRVVSNNEAAKEPWEPAEAERLASGCQEYILRLVAALRDP